MDCGRLRVTVSVVCTVIVDTLVATTIAGVMVEVESAIDTAVDVTVVVDGVGVTMREHALLISLGAKLARKDGKVDCARLM